MNLRSRREVFCWVNDEQFAKCELLGITVHRRTDERFVVLHTIAGKTRVLAYEPTLDGRIEWAVFATVDDAIEGYITQMNNGGYIWM